MQDFKEFYAEAEEMAAELSVLINVLDLYYKVFVCSCGEQSNAVEFADWMYMIKQYADNMGEKINDLLKRNMVV